MSHNVARLKELLFDHEAQALAGLEDKLNALTKLSADERLALTKRIDDIGLRIDNDEILAERISTILSEALHRAEVRDHKTLAHSVAPIVVSTIKAELKNSRDEMVEALYPITGQLVKAYVASAIRELTEKMNRRLERNPFMIRLQSLMTGRSAAEIALSSSADFAIHDIYLIRRGSGALLARWPEHNADSRDHALSGILAAINEFANEALGSGSSDLRKIELGDNNIYLRASPLHLLGARCTGTPPHSVERLLDESFIQVIERMTGRTAETPDVVQTATILDRAGQDLRSNLETGAAETVARQSPLKTLAAFVVMPLLIIGAFFAYERWTLSSAQAAAEKALRAIPAMKGYPRQIVADAFGRKVTVAGLTPDEATHNEAITQVRRALPEAVVLDHLTQVRLPPPVIPDLKPELQRLQSTMTAIDGQLRERIRHQTGLRVLESLKFAADDLDRTVLIATDKPIVATARATSKAYRAIAARLEALLAAVAANNTAKPKSLDAAHQASVAQAAPGIDPATRQLAVQSLLIDVEEAVASLEQLMQDDTKRKSVVKPTASALAKQTDFDTNIERLATHADRAETLSAALALSVRSTLGLAKPVPLTPRQKLIAAIDDQAIFFQAENTYLNSNEAGEIIDKIAVALKQAKAHLRVVGYTDDTGTEEINLKTSHSRAEAVRNDLISRGVPAGRLTTVGRSTSKLLSDATGVSLRNRRVEFELAFPGEPSR